MTASGGCRIRMKDKILEELQFSVAIALSREEVVALLPRGRVTLDPETEKALVRAFGDAGEFEARQS